MASGRPRRPNDPSVMASVEAAISSVARPGPLGRLWHWRYELALATGLPLAAIAIGYTLGLDWLIAMAATALAGMAAVLAWRADPEVLRSQAEPDVAAVPVPVQQRRDRAPVSLRAVRGELRVEVSVGQFRARYPGRQFEINLPVPHGEFARLAHGACGGVAIGREKPAQFFDR